MNIASNVRTDRDRKDRIAFAAGLFVAISPWIAGQAVDTYILFTLATTIAIGAVILLLAQSDPTHRMRVVEYEHLPSRVDRREVQADSSRWAKNAGPIRPGRRP